MDNSRITYDGGELLRLLQNRLDRLNPLRYDSKYRSLLGNVIVDKLDRWDARIRAQQNDPLTVVVCGEFKRGKSTLINALLGEDVVTTDVTTETITVNRVCYGPHSNEIVLSGGKRIRISDEELKSEKLREILRENKGSNQLVLRRPLELLQSMTIIDTPGLGDSLADFTEDVQEALSRADAVVYVFSISYPLSVQEQLFIRTCILPQKYTDLILVGNHSDVAETEEEYARLQSSIRRRTEDILPGMEPVFLSALDERCRQLGTKAPNEELADTLGGAFEKLREHFAELLEDKAEYVVPDRVQRLVMQMMKDLQGDMKAIEDGLQADSEQVREWLRAQEAEKDAQAAVQEKIRASIDAQCEAGRADAIGWIEGLLNRLEADVDQMASVVTTDDIKRYYTLFCLETLQTAFDKCAEHYLSTIYDGLAEVSPDLARDFSFGTAVASPGFVFEVDNNTYTTGDNMALAGDIMDRQLNLGGFVSGVFSYVGGLMREKEVEKKGMDYIASIKQQYAGLHTSVVPALAKEYRTMADRAKEKVSAWFANKLKNMENDAEQFAGISGRNEEQKEEVRAALDTLRSILEDIGSSLGATDI